MNKSNNNNNNNNNNTNILLSCLENLYVLKNLSFKFSLNLINFVTT